MKSKRRFFLSLSTLFLASRFPLYAQPSSSIQDNLDKIESLLIDTLNNSETQSKQLEDLQQTLNESGRIIAENERTMSERE
jgi:hypothetical protein